MSSYRLDLRRGDGSPDREIVIPFERDDDAIDYAGALVHPHGIRVWDGERLVAEFQPLPGHVARRGGPPRLPD